MLVLCLQDEDEVDRKRMKRSRCRKFFPLLSSSIHIVRNFNVCSLAKEHFEILRRKIREIFFFFSSLFYVQLLYSSTKRKLRRSEEKVSEKARESSGNIPRRWGGEVTNFYCVRSSIEAATPAANLINVGNFVSILYSALIPISNRSQRSDTFAWLF